MMQECAVCDTCGKHAPLLANRYAEQLERLPLNWFIKRNHSEAVAINQFSTYCSEGCVSMSAQ